MHISQLQLDLNRPENCPAQLDSGTRASVHYHDYDRVAGARFAMVSMQHAGIRVFDVRDPGRPVEVAYFNPGDIDRGPDVTVDHTWSHVRYVDGRIWYASESGGFWVLELEPRLRRYFALPDAPVTHPQGAPGTTLVKVSAASIPLSAELAKFYCPVGAAA